MGGVKPKIALPTYPPDLIWPSSGDESSVDQECGAKLNQCACCCQNQRDGFVEFEFDTESEDECLECTYGDSSSVASKSSEKKKRKTSAKQSKPGESPVSKLVAEMRKGTELLLSKKFASAKTSFSQVLGSISSSRELSIKKVDEVVLIYTHGLSCLEIGKPKDLKLAKSQFTRILQNFKDVYFPLAQYGCGRVLQKQSKFFDMRLTLMQLLDVLNHKEMRTFKWPGSDIIIHETKPGKLKEAVLLLLDSFPSRPVPDAVCKYKKCSSERRLISFTDTDFKGFVRLLCSESCRIEYHTCCWKNWKTEYFREKITEKFKAEIPKISSEIRPIDKSKRMKSSSFKKQQKKLQRLREKEEWSEEKILKTNHDIENILKELDEEEGEFRIQDKPPNPYIDRNKLPMFFVEDQKPPIQEPSPPDDFNFYVINNNEDSMCDSKSAKAKRKEKKKKKKVKETQSLFEFLGPEHARQNTEMPLEACPSERSGSFSSSVTSISTTDASTLPSEPSNLSIPSLANEQSEQKSMESNVKEHLYIMFEDLLMSKGSMNVDSDKDVQDLFNILDDLSVELIEKSGGLKQFLALSSKFVFDPDNSNVVFPAEEAEIFLKSRNEAVMSSQDMRLFEKRDARIDAGSAVLSNGINTRDSIQNNNSDISDGSDSRTSSSVNGKDNGIENGFTRNLKERDQKNASYSEVSSTDLSMKAGHNVQSGTFGNFSFIPAHFKSPAQQYFTRPLFNPYAKFGGQFRPDKDERNGEITLNLSKTNLQPQGEEGKGTDQRKSSDETSSPHDSMQKGLSASGGRFHFIDNSIVKETVDVAVMTDPNEAASCIANDVDGKEALEERLRQFEDRYENLLDHFEQFKNKVKIDRDALHRSEEEFREKIEKLEGKLCKERQERDKDQKKWHQEKEAFKERISVLNKKMSQSEETRYKTKISEKEEELTKSFEKIGELKLKLEHERQDNEYIIRELETSVNEQSKRALKVLYLDMKKAEVCNMFKNVLANISNTIFAIENNSLLDPSINRQMLRKSWAIYAQLVDKDFHKCKADLDEKLKKVKCGIPLEDLGPFTIPPSPPTPPQPKFIPFTAQNQKQPSASLAPNEDIPMYVPSCYPPMAPPNSQPKLNSKNNDINPAPGNNSNKTMHEMPSGANATPKSAANGTNLISDSTASNQAVPLHEILLANKKTSGNRDHLAVDQSFGGGGGSVGGGSGCAGGGVKNGRQDVVTDGNFTYAKGSNFDRILVRLGVQFPHYGRTELIAILKEFRIQRNNTLSGLTADDIINSISKIIMNKQKETRMQSEKARKPSGFQPQWGVKATDVASSFGFEEPCIICYEDMHHTSGTKKLQCGHVFHTECIRRWLKEQRTCPTCRDHALLQEDFPSLY
eukprot:gene11172-12347_t